MAHIATLIQPVVHLRRPDMQGWDGWLHVNPFVFGASGDTVVVLRGGRRGSVQPDGTDVLRVGRKLRCAGYGERRGPGNDDSE